MHLTEYETTVVIRPDISGDVVETTLDKVRDVVRTGSGKLLAINHWGKKKLAYEIKKHTRGIYVHTHFLGANKLVAELERNLRINENVLRFLTIRLADKVAATEREEKEYVRPQYEADDGQSDDTAEFGSDDEFSGERRERRERRHDDDDDGDGRGSRSRSRSRDSDSSSRDSDSSSDDDSSSNEGEEE